MLCDNLGDRNGFYLNLTIHSLSLMPYSSFVQNTTLKIFHSRYCGHKKKNQLIEPVHKLPIFHAFFCYAHFLLFCINPNVITSQRSATLIQWNDSSDFEHPRVHQIQYLRFSSPFIYQMVFLSYPISPNIIIYSHSKRISTFIVYGNPFMLSL